MQCSKKNNWLYPAIFLSCLLFSVAAAAQSSRYIFRHLTTENGLINTRISTLYQDSKGYIWIGTLDGLQRYDGNRFVNYLPDLHDPEALHDGWINTVFEDSKHRFWVGTHAGAPYLM
ncbi:MAG: two-component regulator propeller domain-containing protein, partial [Ferruginibacter sp.]